MKIRDLWWFLSGVFGAGVAFAAIKVTTGVSPTFDWFSLAMSAAAAVLLAGIANTADQG